MYDCEVPEFYTETFHVCRKESKRKCCECRLPILPGESYVSCRIKYDGDFSCLKQHLCCYHIARFVNYDLKFADVSECIPFGEIKTALRDAAPYFIGINDHPDPPGYGDECCVDVLKFWQRWLSGIKEIFSEGSGI